MAADPMSNRSFDTDVPSAGFAGLLFRRSTPTLDLSYGYLGEDTEDALGARSQSLRGLSYGACDGRERD
jgi:hypothetical protein